MASASTLPLAAVARAGKGERTCSLLLSRRLAGDSIVSSAALIQPQQQQQQQQKPLSQQQKSLTQQQPVSQQHPRTQQLLQAESSIPPLSLSYSDMGLPVVLPSSSSFSYPSAAYSSSMLSPAASLSFLLPAAVRAPPVPFPYGAPYYTAANTSSSRSPFPSVFASSFDPSFLGYAATIFSPAPACFQSKPAAGVSTGTTIVAVTFRDGVVLGADTRTSAGSYVVNRSARKITPIHEKICVCRSGSAADTQALTQIIKLYLQQYAQELPRRSPAAERRKHEQRVAAAAAKKKKEQQHEEEEEEEKKNKEEEEEDGVEETQRRKKRGGGEGQEGGEGEGKRQRKKRESRDETSDVAAEKRGEGRKEGDSKEEKVKDGQGDEREEIAFMAEDARAEPRVKAAAALFQSLCYEYKDTLTAGLIVAGFDALHGPQIYSIPIGGARMRMQCTAGGSGSVYISGFMDAFYRPDMQRDEAVLFVKKCVAHAIARDGSSGGMIRIVVVTKDGLDEESVQGNQLPVRP